MTALLSSAKPALIGLAALLIVALVGGFYAVYQHTLTQNRQLAAANATESLQLDQAQQVNAATLAALDQQKKLHAEDLAAIAAATKAQERSTAAIAALNQEAAHAPSSDDGPIAPVLRRYLAGLRQLDAAAAAPDSGRGAAGGDPGTAPRAAGAGAAANGR